MATKTYAAGDPETVKLWSKRLARETLKETVCFSYFGDSAKSLGTISPDTQKGKGDRCRVTLRMQLNGDGVTENETLEGNEELITTYTDDLLINELAHAPRSNVTISDQRVPFDLGFEMNDALVDWWSARKDTVFFNHLCGYTPANAMGGGTGKYTGFNAVTAPTTGRIIRPSSVTTDEALTSANVMTLQHIDQLKELAETGGSTGLVPIRPISGLPGGAKYACFVHPTHVTSLRASTATNSWMDVQKALLSGGKGEDSMIFKGGLGVYNEVLLVSANRVTPGVNSTTNAAFANTRRAVFCGAQAIGLGFGRGYGPKEWKVKEETFDYGRQLGVSGLNIFGMKKTVFNSSDFATIVLATYAADAA